MTATPDIAATVMAISEPRVYSSHLSPDGKWRAEVVIYDCVKVDPRENADANAVEILKIIRSSDQAEMIIESELLNCGGIGAYGLGGLFWSPNGHYFYYTTAREGVPDGGGGVCWDPPLLRFDVTRGSAEVLSGLWSLSHQGTEIAMARGDNLILWSLDEGETARVPLVAANVAVCQIVWAAGDEALVYLFSACPFCGDSRFSLVYVDVLDGLRQTVLVEIDGYSIVTMKWAAPDQIELWGYKHGGAGWGGLAFNLATGQLSPILP